MSRSEPMPPRFELPPPLVKQLIELPQLVAWQFVKQPRAAFVVATFGLA